MSGEDARYHAAAVRAARAANEWVTASEERFEGLIWFVGTDRAETRAEMEDALLAFALLDGQRKAVEDGGTMPDDNEVIPYDGKLDLSFLDRRFGARAYLPGVTGTGATMVEALASLRARLLGAADAVREERARAEGARGGA